MKIPMKHHLLPSRFCLKPLAFAKQLEIPGQCQNPTSRENQSLQMRKPYIIKLPQDVNQMDLLEVEKTNLELTKGEGKVDLTVKASF